MDYLEKMIFLDLTCIQLGKPNTEHPEYISTFQLLSDAQKNEYYPLHKEVHAIWTFLNMPQIIPLGNNRVQSIDEYHTIIKPINDKILRVCKDFDITLKEPLSDTFKAKAKILLGSDYFTWFDE